MIADYFKEEEGRDTFMTEYGFCTYSINKSTGEFFCAHVYVKPDQRGTGKAVEFGELLEKHAKSIGAKCLTGNVWFNEANRKRFTKKLRFFEAVGFKIDTVKENVITIYKPLE